MRKRLTIHRREPVLLELFLPAITGGEEDAVDAQYKNGLLTVKLPKTEEAKSKKITVKT